ncbi:hypothetical protein BaRGS_00006213, partial [Batillaria attramentaria]
SGRRAHRREAQERCDEGDTHARADQTAGDFHRPHQGQLRQRRAHHSDGHDRQPAAAYHHVHLQEDVQRWDAHIFLSDVHWGHSH